MAKQKNEIVMKGEPVTQTLKVGCLMTDNGDGGYSISIYPSVEEAKAAKRERIIEKLTMYGIKKNVKVTEEKIKYEWDNEYEYGYEDETEIVVAVDANGKVSLAEPIYFHAGQ